MLLCAASHVAHAQDEVPLDRLSLPEGFQAEVYVSGIENARQMALTPSGTLFVGSRQAGNVYAVVDRDADHVADEVVTIASGLNMPSGVAFHDGSLFVGAVNRVLRYDGIEETLGQPPRARCGHRSVAHRPPARLEVSWVWARRQVVCSRGGAVQHL